MSGGRKGAVNVKIGGLWKRSQNLSKLTKPNYKHRVFILTKQSLCYYKGTVDHITALKGRIEVSSIKAIEYVDEGAFAIAHMFQVVYYTRKHGFVPLYVIGRDDQECHEWVSDLRSVCQHNKETLLHYHPGAYRDYIWTCCKKSQRSAMGCHPTYTLLMRGKGNYSDLRKRISAMSVDRAVVGSKDPKGVPKSTSVIGMNVKPTLHKQRIRRRSAEGGATMSNSFVDVTALMTSDVNGTTGVSKACHSAGEISDSCITLPVERMEGVKEGEMVREEEFPHMYNADRVTGYKALSPQLHHHHHQYLQKGHFGSSLSMQSPKHARLHLSSSHLNFQRHSSTSSAGSNNTPANRKVSYSVQVISPTPVPEEEVSELSTRRMEMELMTHNTSPTPQSSLSQPESQSSPTPQVKLAKRREISRSTLDDRLVTSPYLQPRHHSQLWGLEAAYNTHVALDVVQNTRQPQITPQVSETHPCIIHL